MYRLPEIDVPLEFPDDFTTSPEGLLAMGGNLLPETLLDAYTKGIFPWFNRGEPILWWHPEPRCVFLWDKLHVTTKMKRLLKHVRVEGVDCDLRESAVFYEVTFNKAFPQVMKECAGTKRKGRSGTWILPSLIRSYTALHKQRYAQSIEVWNPKGDLVGGLYGVAMGKVFFGESMFSHEDNTSKIALITLCQILEKKGYLFLDAQVESAHLKSLGATGITRDDFLKKLKEGRTALKKPGIWLAEKAGREV